jgi:hypothetical protein
MKLKKIKSIKKLYKIQKYSYDLNKVIAIDPYNFERLVYLENDILKRIKPDEISKKSLISTYIPLNYITTYELTISKNLINKIDLYDHIEAQAYEELELDESAKYIFKYKLIESISDEKNLIAEVVIVQEDILKNYFEPILNKYDYIDYITYNGFLFEVLYQKKILLPQKDIFLFITKNSSLITLYADGMFLQNIVLNDGIESLYEKLKRDDEIDIKHFNYKVFVELLIKKGLNHNYYDDNEEILFNKLSEIFSSFLMPITNQLNSLQRKFALPTIDRIFISTEYGLIPGSIEFSHNYFGEIEVKELKFDTKYNPNNIRINQLLFLTMLSAQYAYEEDYQIDNFTIKRRPPTFFYRKSGQFISIAIASLMLSLVYPTYQYIYSFIQNYENSFLEGRVDILDTSLNTLQKNYAKLLKDYSNDKKIVENKEKYIMSIQKIITTLYKEKNGYVPVSVLLTKIISQMAKDKIYTTDINLENNILKLNVYAKKETFLTNFVTDLVEKEHLNVETNGILKDENRTRYISTVKVNL